MESKTRYIRIDWPETNLLDDKDWLNESYILSTTASKDNQQKASWMIPEHRYYEIAGWSEPKTDPEDADAPDYRHAGYEQWLMDNDVNDIHIPTVDGILEKFKQVDDSGESAESLLDMETVVHAPDKRIAGNGC